MIIIKTKNGDFFINDKNVTEVSHDKEKETAYYRDPNGMVIRIPDVECVTFVSDTQALMYEDKGSRIKELEQVLYEVQKRCNAYRNKLFELGELGNV